MHFTKLISSTLGVILVVSSSLAAQDKTIDDELETVLAEDSLLWTYFNACDISKMRELFTDDLEFYHDKGGAQYGVNEFISTSQKNLCSNDNFRLRRETVSGTVNVFPMQNNGKLYGAILSGEHVFYILEPGKEPRLDGQARFSHLFLKTDKGWKMSRIFSYDHHPATYISKRKQIVLTQKVLQQYAGEYTAPQTGKCIVKPNESTLNLTIGDKVFALYPETNNRFFVTDRDLTFEFITDNASKQRKMVVRENGSIVEEGIRKD